jgi:hypothetical protein
MFDTDLAAGFKLPNGNPYRLLRPAEQLGKSANRQAAKAVVVVRKKVDNRKYCLSRIGFFATAAKPDHVGKQALAQSEVPLNSL